MSGQKVLMLDNPAAKITSIAADGLLFYVANWLISKTGIEKHPRIRHVLIFAIIDALK